MLYNLIRVLLYPALRFVLPLVSSKAKARLVLELENTNNKLDVDYIFHISSEGELEQSLSLIEDYLKTSRVLVIFTSDSVVHKLKELKLYSPNLLIESKRILTYFPFFAQGIYKYKNIRKFFMVRYDFFPELIFYSYNNNSILLNASLLNKHSMNYFSYKYLKFSLLSFNKIVYASAAEAQRFRDINVDRPHFSFDLRALRILKRKEKCLQTLAKLEFTKLIKDDKRKKIIIGSYWNDEFEHIKEAILNSLRKDELVAIAPHKFSDIPNILQTFKDSNIDSIVLSKESELSNSTFRDKVVILNVPGVLCEMYSLFDHAHISGGWHKSIHSVLEPFLMNDSIQISCGDNISRSSEYELIQSINPKRIKRFTQNINLFQSLDSNSKSMYYNFEQEFINLKSFINNE